jgi:hypothetical protein
MALTRPIAAIRMVMPPRPQVSSGRRRTHSTSVALCQELDTAHRLDTAHTQIGRSSSSSGTTG